MSVLDELLPGFAAVLTEAKDRLARVAPHRTTVLVTGPTGSGKEMAARALHRLSGREGAMIAVNCAAIPRELLEAELFGHERGAFTGAVAARRGRFERAQHGTLFLDEIGDMPLDLQGKLLRVLEEGSIERVGAEASIALDIRIVAATHHNLALAVGEGRFRADLYYRLSVFEVAMPSLAERIEDLPLLLERFGAEHGVRFSEDAARRLAGWRWDGNLRELRNLVERAGVLQPGRTIDATLVEPLLARPERGVAVLRRSADIGHGFDLRTAMEAIEARYIGEAMRRGDGTIADAARLLGLGRTTLSEKLRRQAAA